MNSRVGQLIYYLVWAILASAVWFVLVLLAPHFTDNSPSKEIQRLVAATEAELSALLAGGIRVQPLMAGNASVFVERKVLEDVPFPDRPEFLRNLVGNWCHGVSPKWLPTVYFRDIRTGEELDQCSCWDVPSKVAQISKDNYIRVKGPDGKIIPFSADTTAEERAAYMAKLYPQQKQIPAQDGRSLTIRDLGARIKEEYPGAYDDLSDAELGRKLKAKFPEKYAEYQDPNPAGPWWVYALGLVAALVCGYFFVWAISQVKKGMTQPRGR